MIIKKVLHINEVKKTFSFTKKVLCIHLMSLSQITTKKDLFSLSNKRFIEILNSSVTIPPTLSQTGRQAGMQANGKSICSHNCAGNINKFYQKSHSKKFLFSSRLKKDLFLNFFVCHKERYNQENIPFRTARHVCIH